MINTCKRLIAGLIIIVIAGFIYIIIESNHVSKMNVELRKNDLTFNDLVKQESTSFLTVDDQTNMWVGLGIGKTRFGDQKLADDTLNQVISAEKTLTTSLQKLSALGTTAREITDIRRAQKDSETYQAYIQKAINNNESDHQK